jgi:hypothetical protein
MFRINLDHARSILLVEYFISLCHTRKETLSSRLYNIQRISGGNSLESHLWRKGIVNGAIRGGEREKVP